MPGLLDTTDAMSADPISSTQTVVLGLPPSCVEFCPAHPEYFVVGTYNLERDSESDDATQREGQPQSRNGSIIVFRLHDDRM